MADYEFDSVVIGAGVVGLAVARALALSGHSVLVLEQHDMVGMETSSRNSEVIHAGIYYPAGSLKTELCQRGKHLLYDYCRNFHVPHQRIGKWIVATNPSEEDTLSGIVSDARNKGVEDLYFLSARERQEEQALFSVAAVCSPSTGIVDSHALMTSFVGEIEDAGGFIAFRSSVNGGDWQRGELSVSLEDGQDQYRLRTRLVVNAAGLFSARVSTMLGADPDQIEEFRFAKGCYCSYSGKTPFSRLIYPIPEPGGLGVHFTLDMAGSGRFGPDVDWLLPETEPDQLDYSVSSELAARFTGRVRSYFPDLEPDNLVPSYAGIRPKVMRGGDFVINVSDGVEGVRYVGLHGIESPGLTSCLAIAERVQALLDGTVVQSG